jgi:hypothetical protein
MCFERYLRSGLQRAQQIHGLESQFQPALPVPLELIRLLDSEFKGVSSENEGPFL